MSAPVSLLQALFDFAKARKALIAIASVPTGTQKKTAIVFEGDAINFLIAADNVGVALTPIEGGLAVDTAKSAPHVDAMMPPAEKAPRKKAEKAPETPAAQTPDAVPEVVKAMSVDEFRAYAQASAVKLGADGVDVLKKLIGMPIKDVKPEAYAGLKASIDAAIASKAAGLG